MSESAVLASLGKSWQVLASATSAVVAPAELQAVGDTGQPLVHVVAACGACGRSLRLHVSAGQKLHEVAKQLLLLEDSVDIRDVKSG